MKARTLKNEEQLNECMNTFVDILKAMDKNNENFFVPFSSGKYEGLIIPHRTGSGYSVELLIDEIDSAAVQE